MSKKEPVNQQSKRSRTLMRKQARAYREALARLVGGDVTHSTLLKLKAAGKLRINVRTVALEAQRSHTPLYRHYPEIVAAIENAAAKPHGETLGSEVRVRSLRTRIDELMTDRNRLATENTLLALRLEKMDVELARLKGKIEFLPEQSSAKNGAD